MDQIILNEYETINKNFFEIFKNKKEIIIDNFSGSLKFIFSSLISFLKNKNDDSQIVPLRILIKDWCFCDIVMKCFVNNFKIENKMSKNSIDELIFFMDVMDLDNKNKNFDKNFNFERISKSFHFEVINSNNKILGIFLLNKIINQIEFILHNDNWLYLDDVNEKKIARILRKMIENENLIFVNLNLRMNDKYMNKYMNNNFDTLKMIKYNNNEDDSKLNIKSLCFSFGKDKKRILHFSFPLLGFEDSIWTKFEENFDFSVISKSCRQEFISELNIPIFKNVYFKDEEIERMMYFSKDNSDRCLIIFKNLTSNNIFYDDNDIIDDNNSIEKYVEFIILTDNYDQDIKSYFEKLMEMVLEFFFNS